MIACYCRVSSRTQKNDSQKAEIRRWLRGHNIPKSQVLWFEDKATGKNMRRPALEEMEAAIFEGQVKTVVVWKLDRISRSLLDGMNHLARWCEQGIRVVVVTQQIDLSGTVGRMLATVMFGLAEIELEHKRVRQTAGIREARKAGVYKGRKPGTTKAKPQRARKLRERGLTIGEIANALDVSSRTVMRYLADAAA